MTQPTTLPPSNQISEAKLRKSIEGWLTVCKRGDIDLTIGPKEGVQLFATMLALLEVAEAAEELMQHTGPIETAESLASWEAGAQALAKLRAAVPREET